MPRPWNRRDPVVDQEVLKEVLNDNPELLLKRDYDAITRAYQELAEARNLRAKGSSQGIKQVLGRHFQEWDKILKDGGKLS